MSTSMQNRPGFTRHMSPSPSPPVHGHSPRPAVEGQRPLEQGFAEMPHETFRQLQHQGPRPWSDPSHEHVDVQAAFQAHQNHRRAREQRSARPLPSGLGRKVREGPPQHEPVNLQLPEGLDSQRQHLISATHAALHEGRILGEGSFGKVVLIPSNHLGCKYTAVKFQQALVSSKDNREKHIRQELALHIDLTEKQAHRGMLVVCPALLVAVKREAASTPIDEWFLEMPQAHGSLKDVLDHWHSLASKHVALQTAASCVHDAYMFSVEMAQAIDFVHHNGKVHADIKPDNFLFIKGKLLLTDFGLVTQMGHTLRRQGTPGYWAPEVEKEHQIPWSAAQDYWSLGKCLNEVSQTLHATMRQYDGNWEGLLGNNAMHTKASQLMKVLKACSHAMHLPTPDERIVQTRAIVNQHLYPLMKHFTPVAQPHPQVRAML